MDTPQRPATEGRVVGARWFNLPRGIWLIIAPSVLGCANFPIAQRNDVILGVVIAIPAWTNASVRPRA